MCSIRALLIVAILFSNCFAVNANCLNNDSHAQVVSTSGSSELTPLQIAIEDLKSIKDLLDKGDKKTAAIIIKSAQGQLRKISALSKVKVKGMTARLKKAIKFVKSGNNTGALEEINHVLGELQGL